MIPIFSTSTTPQAYPDWSEQVPVSCSVIWSFRCKLFFYSKLESRFFILRCSLLFIWFIISQSFSSMQWSCLSLSLRVQFCLTRWCCCSTSDADDELMMLLFVLKFKFRWKESKNRITKTEYNRRVIKQVIFSFILSFSSDRLLSGDQIVQGLFLGAMLSQSQAIKQSVGIEVVMMKNK